MVLICFILLDKGLQCEWAQVTSDSHIDPTAANNAFWQSCTLLLAAALETAFHHKHNVRVISLPVVSPQSGGFTCDISFDPTHKSFTNWIPSSQELYALSTHIQRMAINELNFEPLDVPVDNELFQKLFADNPLRSKQISQVFNRQSVGESQFNERNSLPVYRVGDFVEVIFFWSAIKIIIIPILLTCRNFFNSLVILSL
ncbi:unnamed protein product [Trichobilharzia regenti]|nr:unnamed protein product [Trichobilharzia regenti]